MAVRTEELQLRVLIDGSPARRELAQLDQEYAELNRQIKTMGGSSKEAAQAMQRLAEIDMRRTQLRQEIGLTGLTAKQLTDELRRLQQQFRNLTPNTPMWTDTAQRIDQVKARLHELNNANARAQAAWETQRQGMRLTSMTMEQLEREATRLREAMRTMMPDSAQFRQAGRDLQQVEDRLSDLKNNLSPMQALWRNIKQELNGVLGVSAVLFGGSMVVGKIQDWVRGAAQLSDAYADVQKTTNLTGREVQDLARKIGQINTRTARSELLELARDAGKLGITASKDILQFVRAGDQIRVALGEDLGDEAIKTLAKLNEVYKVTSRDGYDLERSLLGVGSAINELGMSSTASEGYMVDFAARMGGVNAQTGITIEQTLGYASALDQLQLQAETSSTALSQFTLKAFKDTGTYARIAGMDVQEFSALLNSDTNEALLRVLEGLNGNNEGLQRMTGLFADMGQEGARAVSVLSSLAKNTHLVREAQEIATKAMAEGTSITAEFATRNNNLAADLEIIGKRVASAFMNSAAINGLKSIVGTIREWVEIPLSQTLEQERMEMMALYAQVLTTNEGTEERVRLIKELQSRYPQYLGNIDAETVSNKELGVAIGELNKQLINKILLQRQDEAIQKQAQNQADEMQALLDREQKLRAEMIRLAQKYNVEIAEGDNLIEQATQTLWRMEEADRAARGGRARTGGRLLNDLASFGNALYKLERQQAALNNEERISNQLMQERQDLIARLGIDLGGPAHATPTDTPEAPNVPAVELDEEKSDKERDKLRKQLEAWHSELTEFRERMFQAGLSDNERELRVLDLKHEQERQKLRENKLATEADLRALEEQQERERADLIAAHAEERLNARSEAADKMRLALLSELEKELEATLSHWDELIALGQQHRLDVADLEEAKQKALDAIRQKWAQKAQDDLDRNNAEELRKFREMLAQRIAMMQAFNTLASSVEQMYSVIKQHAEQEADADGERTQDEIDRLQELERARRRAALVQIVLSQATAVAQAISAGAGVPWPANLAAIASGLAAVISGIAQAYALLSAPMPNASGQQQQGQQQGGTPSYMPTGAAGGSWEYGDEFVPAGKGGRLTGPRHSHGGLKVVDPYGRVRAEVEGGELLLSRKFRQVNPELEPILLHASATGAKVTLGEVGGVFSPMQPFAFRRASDAIQIMALGGVLPQADPEPAATGDKDGAWAEAIVAELRANRATLSALLQVCASWPERTTAVVSLEDLHRKEERRQQLRDLNRVAAS